MSRLLLALVLLLSACTASPPMQTKRILWPLPPMEPKVEFIGAFSSNLDLIPKEQRNHFFELLFETSATVHLESPFGVASDAGGVFYVTDKKSGRLVSISLSDRLMSVPLRQLNLCKPLGITIDEKNQFYIVDSCSKSIVVYDQNFNYLKAIGNKDELERPSYLAINNRINRLYVSDGKLHKVAVYDLSGTYLFSFGSLGDGGNNFASPHGIAIDEQDNLYIADMLNCRIKVHDKDGKFLYSFGERNADYLGFEAPKDVKIGPDGALYIIDQRKSLLFSYSKKGEIIFALGDSLNKTSELAFSTPTSVDISDTGILSITDPLNNRVSFWQILTDEYRKLKPITDNDLKMLDENIARFRKMIGKDQPNE